MPLNVSPNWSNPSSILGFIFAVMCYALLLGFSPSVLSTLPSQNALKVIVDNTIQDRCDSCHNDYDFTTNWSVSDIDVNDIEQGKNQHLWEAILKSVALGDMPPADKKPLDTQKKASLLYWLETSLDHYSEQNPNPGRATIRRLNRNEYANSVRDLLALDIDISQSLPGDDSGYGFDNNADVLGVSTTLLERYISIAGKLSRQATGVVGDTASKKNYLIPKDGPVKNSGVPSFNLRMHDDLPLDSRGGGSVDFYAPIAGKYEIAGFINANTNNEVDRLDIHRHSYTLSLPAGNHEIGMTFRKELALSEHVPTVREGTSYVVLPDREPTELDLDFIVDGSRVHTKKVPSYHMSARFSQAAFLRDVLEIEIIGPLEKLDEGQTANVENSANTTPSYSKIFSCYPKTLSTIEQSVKSELSCAKQIIASLVEQAYRRPIDEADIEPLMGIFKQTRRDLDFKASIATTIQALLVSPSFLYLQEHTPKDIAPGSVYKINDYEFAARLALFLWSSLPDQELSELAKNGSLREPAIIRQQIKRMLASEKSKALTDNFAGQWLYLRNLPRHFPDVFEFPNFDIPLKQAIKRETELFFTRILKDNLSIFDFLNANYSYLNERLAAHYGIEGVKGHAFRKVFFGENSNRGGLLGQASILTLTSNPNHTSPVKRGKWILDNLLAATPPPPPPDVPSLIAEHDGVALSAKEQLARHREDPVCASCHVRMDPLGLALEKYDAVGAFRTVYAKQIIDTNAQMPDGTVFDGLPGLHSVLWDRRERFAQAFIDRIMTYALGRGLKAFDKPTIRQVARQASLENYQIHSIIEAVVTSIPFNYKKAPEEASDEERQIAQAR
ncbi:DUF1592 domain-containing protein [Glaciecola petra]|uniref:DUF1592 domain-containing protein n=1 Tax=Glaciecola petra TaxID=3075602 RepID=A0ABU2ZTX2_9ALTE|nr:DUF1592 domain-containing protein [Aestuariibacter sp. P117]MDT0596088.1 DUF1592 domain-containing protein [Aestuariibacter sp. P117]